MKWWHWFATHAGIAALFGVSVLAWFGWHRPIPQNPYVGPRVVQVQPGETRVLPVVLGGQTIPQVVTAPAPEVRIITSPPPPVVPSSPAQQRQIERQANIVVIFDLTRDCVHPDVTQAPDPTCGAPVDGHLELIQNGAGFVRIAHPSQALQTGPITTQLNHVIAPAIRPWGIGVGAMGIADRMGFHGLIGPDVTYTRSFGAVQFSATGILDARGRGVGGLAIVNIIF